MENTKVPMSSKKKAILALVVLSLLGCGLLIAYKNSKDTVTQDSYDREREYIDGHGGRQF